MRRGRGGPRGVAARFPGCVCAWRWGVRRGEGGEAFPGAGNAVRWFCCFYASLAEDGVRRCFFH